MHTMNLDSGWLAHHNGDFSGTVILRSPGGGELMVPYTVLESIVAEKIRGERISQLEQATTKELLGGSSAD